MTLIKLSMVSRKKNNPFSSRIKGFMTIKKNQSVITYSDPMFIQYAYQIHKKANPSTIYSRGYIIESYPNKTEQEILEFSIKNIEIMKKTYPDFKVKYEVIR